jgi:multidrug transporter EmrE-like cation transporter
MQLFPLILLAILTQALGNVLLSRGMKEVNAAISDHLEASQYLMVALATVSNIYFLFGLLLLIIGFLLFLTLLSRADLSYVLPVTSFSYVLVALFAVYLLNEHIPLTRWLGILFICSGVLLVSRGESMTSKNRTSAKTVEAKIEGGL